MESSNSKNKALIGLIVIVLLVTVAAVVMVLGAKDDQSEQNAINETSPTPTVSATNEPDADANQSESTGYKDGTYSATGNYQTPGGRESIDVTVTLSSGAITDATVEQNARGGEAEEYQNKFVSSFKSQVVGKKIDEVSLSRVAGSSLTPNGFNSAIKDIANQAKA